MAGKMARTSPQELLSIVGIGEPRDEIRGFNDPVSCSSKYDISQCKSTISGFNTLPVEIIDQITNDIPLHDFAALRLVSIEASSKSLHSFTQRFFAKRNVRVQWKSMNNLLSILSHEHFGPALMELHLMFRSYASLKPYLYPSSATISGDEVKLRTLPEVGPPDAKIIGAETSSTHAAAKLSFQNHLDRIFSRISSLQCLQCSFTHQNLPWSTLHSARIYQSNVGTVLTVMAFRNVSVKALILGGKLGDRTVGVKGQAGRPFEHFSYFSSKIDEHSREFRSAFENTTHFELKWPTIDRWTMDNFSRAEYGSRFPNNLFGLMTNLQTLILSNNNQDFYPHLSFRAIDQYVTSLHKLRKVVFQNIENTPKLLGSLKRFRLEIAPALRELYLHALWVDSDVVVPWNTNEELEERLKKELELDKVEVEREPWW